jgi:chromosome segregation ATPase
MGQSSRASDARSVVTAASSMRSSMISTVDLSKRPVTGAGGGLARTKRASVKEMQVIESAGYYSYLLQQKIEEIVNEMQRLEKESEMADGASEARRKLDNEHKIAVGEIQKLEAALADINLAKDKARSGSNDEEIREECIELSQKNKGLEREIDEIFIQRKRIESQTLKLESQIKQLRDETEQKLMAHPEMLYNYQMLLDLMQDIQREESEEDGKMNELEAQIRSMDADGNLTRYKQAKDRALSIERQIAQVEADIELIALDDEHDAKRYLLDKVKRIDAKQRKLDKQCLNVQAEIELMLDEQSEMKSRARMKGYSPKDPQLLYKINDEQRLFLADMPQIKTELEDEKNRLTVAIELLRDNLDKRSSPAKLNLPTQEEFTLMKDEVAFTSKQIDNNKETIVHLQQQRKAREMELEKINMLEFKIDEELKEIERKTQAMKQEMDAFQSADELEASADAFRDHLIELSEACTEKLELHLIQLQNALSENEQKKKALESEPNWPRIELLQAKLHDQGQEIKALQRDVDELKAKNDYENLKDECMNRVNKINDAIIAKQ